ncbi:cysteine proteinase [Delitschia confertaspora ATCC 74209]|uniref:Ubiquitin carboxyl-terminal hydrolase n=1 Tax=Delitschia confertaspora ATCC 74209 TaxID=1513339 RepID=A0A9P4JM51_9PLEO|nr:cysteine proteinase [Delitschia confertaspora ATCC 74209]
MAQTTRTNASMATVAEEGENDAGAPPLFLSPSASGRSTEAVALNIQPLPKSRKRNVSPDHSPKRAKLSTCAEPAKNDESAVDKSEIPAVDGTQEAEKGDEEAPKTPQRAVAQPQETYPSPPEVQATLHDKKTWQGFCDIESEPDVFSVMIREMGVKDVCVKEVFTMDPEDMSFLPRPIYGLVLLFQYRLLDIEKDDRECPENVWFANQMPNQNSCASLAMLNVLMNTRGVELGENLQQFKEFTSSLSFTPYLRGQEIANFEFVKHIHNSFAKKMDMLQADYELKKRYEHDQKKGRGRKLDKEDSLIEEEANHFIAFTPIDGEVWKLDGMDRVPTSVGQFKPETDDWVELAHQKIMEIMAAGGDLVYTLLAMVRSPQVGLRSSLCANVASLDIVEGRLRMLDRNWVEKVHDNDDVIKALRCPGIFQAGLGITADQLTSAQSCPDAISQSTAEDFADLVGMRMRLLAGNVQLQKELRDRMNEEAEQDEKANERRWDYGPVVATWLKKLAENGYLEQNLE